jgi:hypothetical protein
VVKRYANSTSESRDLLPQLTARAGRRKVTALRACYTVFLIAAGILKARSISSLGSRSSKSSSHLRRKLQLITPPRQTLSSHTWIPSCSRDLITRLRRDWILLERAISLDSHLYRLLLILVTGLVMLAQVVRTPKVELSYPRCFSAETRKSPWKDLQPNAVEETQRPGRFWIHYQPGARGMSTVNR